MAVKKERSKRVYEVYGKPDLADWIPDLWKYLKHKARQLTIEEREDAMSIALYYLSRVNFPKNLEGWPQPNPPQFTAYIRLAAHSALKGEKSNRMRYLKNFFKYSVEKDEYEYLPDEQLELEIINALYVDQVWLAALKADLGPEEYRMALEIMDDPRDVKKYPEWQLNILREYLSDTL